MTQSNATNVTATLTRDVPTKSRQRSWKLTAVTREAASPTLSAERQLRSLSLQSMAVSVFCSKSPEHQIIIILISLQCLQIREPFALAPSKKATTKQSATSDQASEAVKRFALASRIFVMEPPQSKPQSVFY